MSDLFESLKQLKMKLTNIEEDYESKTKDLLKRNKANESIDKKLDKLTTIQNDKIQVEAGGKFYETSKATVEACLLDNILRDQIGKQNNSKFVVDYVNNNQGVSNLFVDIGSKDFKLILKIMRHISNCDSKYNVYYSDEFEKDRLESVLNYFFKNDEKLNYLINFVQGTR
jgi:hypothetical protein